MKKDNRKVLITHLPLSKDKEQVFSIVKRSRLLINSICEYSKDLRKRGIEVYERKVNIIRTEHGYFCAFFEEDIKEGRAAEGEQKEQKIEPFTGIDGRQKVQLTDKEGDIVIEDLATIVATTFKLPNPDNLSYVLFKDNDPTNCKIENLYWSNTK